MSDTTGSTRPKVVGYARVSTKEQAGGYSPDGQVAKLRMYCELHGLDLVAVHQDLGRSGKNLDRPGLREALDDLDSGRAGGLVVAKLDRLTRSVRDLDRLLEGWFTGGVGADLHSVGDSIDTTTAVGRLVLNVVVSVAQWERETIAERVQDGHDMARREGTFAGEAPYGWDVGGVKGEKARPLVPVPEEQAVIARILRERREGRSLRKIASGLSADLIPTKRQRWTGTKIKALDHRDKTGRDLTAIERHALKVARGWFAEGASPAGAAAILNDRHPDLVPRGNRWSVSSIQSILKRHARNAALQIGQDPSPAPDLDQRPA